MSRYVRVDTNPDSKQFAHYWVVRYCESKTLHVCWYDPATHQVGRRSLKTTNLEQAFVKVRALEDRGIVGDPGTVLNERPLQTVTELLDWHLPYTQTLASAEAEEIAINRLKGHFGSRRIASLVLTDFERFRDAVVAKGLTIGTVSRTLTVLRSAVKRAVKNRRLRGDDAPFVPEFATKNYWRSVPPKARIMTLDELASLFDMLAEMHLIVYSVYLINTVARPGAILDLTAAQIDLARGLLALNPPGRIQTTKFRPVLPITDTLRPWCTDLAPGHLITWRGHSTSMSRDEAPQPCLPALPPCRCQCSRQGCVLRHIRLFP